MLIIVSNIDRRSIVTILAFRICEMSRMYSLFVSIEPNNVLATARNLFYRITLMATMSFTEITNVMEK